MKRHRQPPEEWVPNADLDVSVLAWRAVEPSLPKRGSVLAALGRLTGSGGATGRFGIGSGGKMFSGSPATESLAGAEQSALRDAQQQSRDAAAARLAPFQLACVELARRLSHDEASELRASGQLPDWFRPELDRRADDIRRELRKK